MGDETEIVDFSNQRSNDRFSIFCACGDDGHILSFDVYHWSDDFGETSEVSLRVMDEHRTPRGVGGRIRAAIALFVKGEYCRGEVQLGVRDLMAIQDWCRQRLQDGGHISESGGAAAEAVEGEA